MIRWCLTALAVVLAVAVLYYVSRARAGEDYQPHIIVPLELNRQAGIVTIWLADLYRLVHANSHLRDEHDRIKKECGET